MAVTLRERAEETRAPAGGRGSAELRRPPGREGGRPAPPRSGPVGLGRAVPGAGGGTSGPAEPPGTRLLIRAATASGSWAEAGHPPVLPGLVIRVSLPLCELSQSRCHHPVLKGVFTTVGSSQQVTWPGAAQMALSRVWHRVPLPAPGVRVCLPTCQAEGLVPFAPVTRKLRF